MTRRKICTQRLYGCVDHVKGGVRGLGVQLQCYVKHVETGLLLRTERDRETMPALASKMDECGVAR